MNLTFNNHPSFASFPPYTKKIGSRCCHKMAFWGIVDCYSLRELLSILSTLQASNEETNLLNKQGLFDYVSRQSSNLTLSGETRVTFSVLGRTTASKNSILLVFLETNSRLGFSPFWAKLYG